MLSEKEEYIRCVIHLVSNFQMTETRERASSKERSTQSKILDLETQLSRTTSEINQLQRSKEEVKVPNYSLLQNLYVSAVSVDL